MKKMILVVGALLITLSAFADTVSERRAKEVAAILQSKEVGALLSQIDGVGNFQGIKYLFSYRASYGPAIYQLSFRSNFGPVPQICTVPVALNIETTTVMKVESAECKEIE